MTHRVDSAVFRIGKSLNWHSLGSPLFRFRDLKMSLFLNYFLSRFLEKESYSLVRYGLRSEAGFLKIAIIAFRISTTVKNSAPKGLYDPYFETYWKGNRVIPGRFIKIGVFKNKLLTTLESINPMHEDLVGNFYTDGTKRGFSINPVKNWRRILGFFLDGSYEVQNFDRESIHSAVVGLNIYYYIRLASRLLLVRYAVRKSAMRVLRRRVLPVQPRIFKRKFLDFSCEFLESHFCDARPTSIRYKNFLFSYLISSLNKKKNLLKRHFSALSLRSLNLITARCAALKLKKNRILRSKKNMAVLKKKYFLFKKNNRKWARRSKILLSSRLRFFRRGRYRLGKFFKRLNAKNKGFKHSLVYSRLRRRKNASQQIFLNYKNTVVLRRGFKNCLTTLRDSLNLVFKAVAGLILFFRSPNLGHFIKINFLFSFILRRYAFFNASYPYRRLRVKFLRGIPGIFSNFKKEKLPVGLLSSAGMGISKINKKILFSINFFKLKYFKFKRIIIRSKNYSKINFFFYFFFANFAIFKFYRLKFKPDSAKQLYRKKKFFFIFEKRLSLILKTRVMLKLFNPLDSSSMDDLWTRSLFNSLNVVSNMYMRNKLDFKPTYILALYAMLAFKYNSPAVLGAYVANQLSWRWRKRSHASFMRILIFFFKSLRLDTMYTGNLVNFSIGFYGKVWGKLRAGKLIIRGVSDRALSFRRVSLKMDSSFTWAESQFGTFGIRIWIARN